MPRKKSIQQELDDSTLPIVPGRSTKNKQTLLDPQASLPGAMKRVGPKLQKTEKEQNKADPKHLRQKFAQYCKELANSMGDPVPALAIVFDITIEEASERQVELHAEITKAVNVMSTKELFDMHGLSKQHRVVRLGQIFWGSDNVAAIIRVAESLNDMDGSAKSSGDTWEEFAAMAMGKRS